MNPISSRFPAPAVVQTLAAILRLGFLGFILVAFARVGRANDPFHLDRLGVVRFVPLTQDTLLRETGTLFFDGRVQWRSSIEQPRPHPLPLPLLSRPLVPRTVAAG